MRTPGLEPGWVAPPAPKADSLPLSEAAPNDGTTLDDAGHRPETPGTTTATTTARGPLEKACRDAGLPPTADSLMYLEQLAQRAGLTGRHAVTPAMLRKAARLHRKMVENPRRFGSSRPEDGSMSRRQGKQQLAEEHGLTSGRQWKRWKKEQQRILRASRQDMRPEARTFTVIDEDMGAEDAARVVKLLAEGASA
jgi:hypothetical protein